MPGQSPRLSGLDFCAPKTGRNRPQDHFASSWPDLIRPSTSSDGTEKGVDARIKSGHDDPGLLNCRMSTTDFAKPDSRGLDPAIHALQIHKPY